MFMIEYYGIKPEITISGKGSSVSRFSFLAALLTYAFSVWVFYYTGKELFLRKYPTVDTSNQYTSDPAAMNFSPTTFNMAVFLEDPNTYVPYIDETIFKVKATVTTRTTYVKDDGTVDAIFDSNQVEIESCKSEHFGEFAPNLTKAGMSGMFCLSDTKNITENPVQIKGDFDADVWTYVSFDFYPCRNETSTIACADASAINALLDGSYFGTYFTDFNIQSNNYSDPKFSFLSSQISTFSQKKYKEFIYYIKHLDVDDNTGWLFETSDVVGYQKLDRYLDLSDDRAVDYFLRLTFRLSTTKTVVTRRYTKLSDVLAQATGLISTVMVFAFIIIFPFLKMDYYQSVINELFDIQISNSRSHSKKFSVLDPRAAYHNKEADSSPNKAYHSQIDTKGSPIELANLQKAPNLKENSAIYDPNEPQENSISHLISPEEHPGLNNELIKKDLECVDSNHLERDNTAQGPFSKQNNNDDDKAIEIKSKDPPSMQKLKISWFEFMKSKLTKNQKAREKVEILNNGIEQINQRLDILNILRKLREIDKLKALLFDYDQLNLFNHLPKPLLITKPKEYFKSSQSQNDNRMMLDPTFVEKAEKETLRKSFDALRTRSRKGVIDEKLLEIFKEIMS